MESRHRTGMGVQAMAIAVLLLPGCTTQTTREVADPPTTLQEEAARWRMDAITLIDCAALETAAYAKNEDVGPLLPERFAGNGLLLGHTTIMMRPMLCETIVVNNTTMFQDEWLSWTAAAVTDREGDLDNGIHQLQYALEVVVYNEALAEAMVSLGLPTVPGTAVELVAGLPDDTLRITTREGSHEVMPLQPGTAVSERSVAVPWHLVWQQEDGVRLLPFTSASQEAEEVLRPATWAHSGGILDLVFGGAGTEAAQVQRTHATYDGVVTWAD